jgi:hypothetical protein
MAARVESRVEQRDVAGRSADIQARDDPDDLHARAAGRAVCAPRGGMT